MSTVHAVSKLHRSQLGFKALRAGKLLCQRA